MRSPAIGTLLVVCIVAAQPFAQSQVPPKPTFAVASVKKRVEPPGPGTLADFQRRQQQRDVFSRVNTTVAALVKYAHNIRDFQLVGGPAWIHQDHFDIEAKAASQVPTEEMRLMLQSLLEERFGLVTHKNQREMRFFAMVLARSDGGLGPYLHRMPEPCNYADFDSAEKGRPKPSGYASVGGMCARLSSFEDTASNFVELPVFDKTGLTGRWSFMLYFAPGPESGIQLAVAPDPNLASFPVALQEQLGLKLEATRGPVDVLVIDSVQQPTEN